MYCSFGYKLKEVRCFQSEHGKRKVNSSATEMGAELQKWKQAFTKASENNSELQRAMQLHLQNLRVLASPLSEVKSALPNAWSALSKCGSWLGIDV